VCFKVLEGNYGPLIQTGGIILFVLIFNFIIKALLIKLRNRFSAQNHLWSWGFVVALPKPLNFLVWYIAAICTVDTISSGFFDFHLMNIHALLDVGLVLFLGWFLLRLNKKICLAMMDKSRENLLEMTPGKLDLLSKLTTVCILFFTLFLLMEVTGRSVQTLIAFGGIGGLALAFASQQMISNFFGGLMIYITHPFTIGEWVNLPERKIEGHVEEIGWYLTRIRNFEKRPIYVPNSVFTQTIVITPSRMSHERFHNKIGLRYHAINVVKPIIDEIKLLLLNHPSIDQNLNVDVFFTGFGASTLDIDISAYIAKTKGIQFSALKQELFFKIADIVKQHGAELATPTNVVEIHGWEAFKQSDILNTKVPAEADTEPLSAN
jgi:MscS family membrane protein